MMDTWASSTGAALSHQAPPSHLDTGPAPEGEVLEVTATVTERGQREDRLVVPIAEFAGRHLATDFIEYDICTARGSLAKGFFYTPFRMNSKNGELGFRRGLGIDQFGREQIRGPATRGGKGVWEHRVMGLLEGAPGPLRNHAMVFAGNRAGTFKIYIDNLRIRHIDGSTSPIWQDVSVRAVQLTDLNTKIDFCTSRIDAPSAGDQSRRWMRALLMLGLGALVVVIAYRVVKKR